MGDRDLALILHRIRHRAAEVGGISDSQLLQRFIADRDEAAFELILWRHARLVFKKRDAVASWLYKVAYRTALTLRGQRAGKAPVNVACS